MKILPLLLLLTGCAVSREVHLADGWPAYEVYCSGPLASFGDCLETAGEICPAGYTVLDRQGGDLPASPTALPSGGPTHPSLKMEARRLFVKCR